MYHKLLTFHMTMFFVLENVFCLLHLHIQGSVNNKFISVGSLFVTVARQQNMTCLRSAFTL